MPTADNTQDYRQSRILRWFTIVGIGFAFAVIVASLVYRFGGYWERDQNVEAARKHAEMLMTSIADNPRYDDVEMSAHHTGSLSVFGEVASEVDLDDLERIVKDSDPPVLTRWRVDIEQDN